MGYKYYIKIHGHKYYFGLYPNNSNVQAIAISSDYSSYKDAKDAIQKLQSLLASSQNLFLVVKKENGYSFELGENEEGLAFFSEKMITHRYEVQKCIARIYKNYDSPLKLFD